MFFQSRTRWAAITVASLGLFASVYSFAGPRDSGGGDLCEDRIKIIRDDITEWIKAGGPQGLKLPAGVSVQQYSKTMLDLIDTTKVRCVGPQDSAYPIAVDGTPKICRFDKSASGGRISCDFTKFSSLSESDQYVLVHHEYAGLSGIEKPNGDDSRYDVSNQISEYLVDQVVKKLAIKLNSSLLCPEEDKRVAPATGTVFCRDRSIPTLGEAYRDPSGLIWGNVIHSGNMSINKHPLEASEYCAAAGNRLPTQQEYRQLTIYLGYGSDQGYSPFLSDGRTQIIPRLNESTTWSSTTEREHPGSFYFFSPAYKNAETAWDSSFTLAFRCVAKK